MTTNDDVYLHAGGLLMFSSGEYSDYGTNGCFVALETLTRSRLREIADQTERDHKAAGAAHDAAIEAWEANGRPEGQYPAWPADPHHMFVAEMIRQGLLLSVTYTELHIGSYSRLELAL